MAGGNANERLCSRLRERWEEDHEGEEWEAEDEPIISPMLASVEGGVKHVLDALRAYDDPDARAFLETMEECSSRDRKHLNLEAISFAAGIGSLRLAEIAQTAIFLYDGMKTKMLLASGLPGIGWILGVTSIAVPTHRVLRRES
jgi:hypothetical protein